MTFGGVKTLGKPEKLGGRPEFFDAFRRLNIALNTSAQQNTLR